jgi:hypothetical protein
MVSAMVCGNIRIVYGSAGGDAPKHGGDVVWNSRINFLLVQYFVLSICIPKCASDLLGDG